MRQPRALHRIKRRCVVCGEKFVPVGNEDVCGTEHAKEKIIERVRLREGTRYYVRKLDVN